MGANLIATAKRTYAEVSIHAPVWGRTRVAGRARPGRVPVSIHAPVWGRTTLTIRHGAEPLAVSIHAPVWGRTWDQAVARQNDLRFNPRPRVGANGVPPQAASCRKMFQSTPPCGGEHVRSPLHGRLCSSFNPRPRVGANLRWGTVRQATTRFQSTPPCGGERRLRGFLHGDPEVSIHAPVWGRTVTP